MSDGWPLGPRPTGAAPKVNDGTRAPSSYPSWTTVIVSQPSWWGPDTLRSKPLDAASSWFRWIAFLSLGRVNQRRLGYTGTQGCQPCLPSHVGTTRHGKASDDGGGPSGQPPQHDARSPEMGFTNPNGELNFDYLEKPLSRLLHFFGRALSQDNNKRCRPTICTF